MDYVIQDCWTMISQDLVNTAIDQFSKDLLWSFVLKVDIMSIAWIRLNKAYMDCDKTLWHTSKLILLESVSTDIYKVPYFTSTYLYIPWIFGERGSTPHGAMGPSFSFFVCMFVRHAKMLGSESLDGVRICMELGGNGHKLPGQF